MGEKEGYLPFPHNFETICVHHTATVDTTSPHKEIPTPLVMSNFYDSKTKCQFARYVSGRIGNSTRCVLENVLAVLSKAKYGICFSSGMGAIGAVLALLKTGDHIIASDDLYGGTTEVLCGLGPKFCINTSFVDFCNMANVDEAVRPETKMIWTENPTNPKLKVIDLCCTTKIARRHCLLTVTDNTFLTPFLQRPLDFGIDLVVHSVTKYFNGHSDVIMGSVCTNRDDLYHKLKYIQRNFGHIPSSFDCYHVLRGLKTFPQRMKRHQQSSLVIAKYLTNHPKIEVVIHPGLPTHPQHELFKSQTSGHSGVLSFYMKGCYEEALKFVNNLKIFTHAVSLGGYESLVEIPVLCSHLHVPDDLKEKLGLTENFLRMSVGLEDPCDLIDDIEQALDKV